MPAAIFGEQDHDSLREKSREQRPVPAVDLAHW